MNTSQPDDKSAQAEPAAAQNSPNEEHSSTSGIPFDEYKKKLEERLGELGKQMDTLKDLLSKAAHDAKQQLEQQLDKLQKDHAEEFERLAKLRAAGEAGLSTLGARLDKLVEDVTAAITSALGFAKKDEAKADDTKPATAGDDAKSATPADDTKSEATQAAGATQSEPAAAVTTAPAAPVTTDAAQYYADAAQHTSGTAQKPSSQSQSPSSQSQKPSSQSQKPSSQSQQPSAKSPTPEAQGPASPIPPRSEAEQSAYAATQQPTDTNKGPSNDNQ